jgi:hypothetical protein
LEEGRAAASTIYTFDPKGEATWASFFWEAIRPVVARRRLGCLRAEAHRDVADINYATGELDFAVAR